MLFSASDIDYTRHTFFGKIRLYALGGFFYNMSSHRSLLKLDGIQRTEHLINDFPRILYNI